MNFFGGSSDSKPAEPTPTDSEMPPATEAEKTAMVADVQANVYLRRSANWEHFRKGFSLRELIFRSAFCGGLWFFVYFMLQPGVPTGRENKQWVMAFCTVMLIYFCAMHSLAYLPQEYFGSSSDIYSAVSNRVSSYRENANEVTYLLAIIIGMLILYPFLFFYYLIIDGFNPYDELTY